MTKRLAIYVFYFIYFLFYFIYLFCTNVTKTKQSRFHVRREGSAQQERISRMEFCRHIWSPVGFEDFKLLLLLHQVPKSNVTLFIHLHPSAQQTASLTFIFSTSSRSSVTMADREHLVYQAKLAEQAERYDGELIFLANCVATHLNKLTEMNIGMSYYYW